MFRCSPGRDSKLAAVAWPPRGRPPPVLSAATRAAFLEAGRGEETAIQTEQRNWLFLKERGQK